MAENATCRVHAKNTVTMESGRCHWGIGYQVKIGDALDFAPVPCNLVCIIHHEDTKVLHKTTNFFAPFRVFGGQKYFPLRASASLRET
jgi:hypothetical protein